MKKIAMFMLMMAVAAVLLCNTAMADGNKNVCDKEWHVLL